MARIDGVIDCVPGGSTIFNGEDGPFFGRQEIQMGNLGVNTSGSLIMSLQFMLLVLVFSGCGSSLTEGEKQYNAGAKSQQGGRLEKAIAEYDEAVRLGFVRHIVYVNRGFAYYRLGQYQDAIEDYDRGVLATAVLATEREMPSLSTRGDAYLNRALAYARLEQPQRAIQDLDEAIRHGVSSSDKGYKKGECPLTPPPTRDWVAAVRTSGVRYSELSKVPEMFVFGGPDIWVCPLPPVDQDLSEAASLEEMFTEMYRAREAGRDLQSGVDIR